MLDDVDATWWYEDGGRQAGPVTAAALQRLLAEGRVSPAHRVWKNGMPGWTPMNGVAELEPVLRGAGPPPPPAPPALPPPFSPPPAATFPLPPTATFRPPPHGRAATPPWSGQPAPTVAPATFEEIPVGLTVFLTILTLGIYGLVKYYQTGKGYEQLAGRESRFSLYFWLFVGLGVAGVLLNGVIGIPFGLASAVFQVLALNEALLVREEGMRRSGITVPVTSASTHRVLVILGIVLSVAVVGLVLFVVEAAKWFGDWNGIAAAVRA